MRTTLAISLIAIGACAAEPEPRFQDPVSMIAVDDTLVVLDSSGDIHVLDTDGNRLQRAGAHALAACSNEIRATSTRLYWRDCDARIWRADRDGTHAQQLFQIGGQPFVVDDTYVYSGLYHLTAYPLDGGVSEERTSNPVVIDSIALDGTTVYVGAGTPPFTDGPLVGGIYRGEQRLIPNDEGFHFHLVVGEGILAWSTQEHTYRANLDGTNVMRIGAATQSGLQIRDGRIWWASMDDDLISTALDGTDPQIHFTSDVWLVGPAFIDGRAYVLEQTGRRIDARTVYGGNGYRLVAIDL